MFSGHACNFYTGGFLGWGLGGGFDVDLGVLGGNGLALVLVRRGKGAMGMVDGNLRMGGLDGGETWMGKFGGRDRWVQ